MTGSKGSYGGLRDGERKGQERERSRKEKWSEIFFLFLFFWFGGVGNITLFQNENIDLIFKVTI